MPNVPFIDLAPQNEPLRAELTAALAGVVDSGRFTLGPEVAEFEQAFAGLHGCRYGVALNSGTSALHLGLLALGVGPGDEVITVAHTFAATVEAILYCGARPVYVDIHPRTLVMDGRCVEAAITPRTRAILPVHLYGNPVDMAALKEIADAHRLPILEDACQAHGALYRERPVGSIGAAGTFSFYPTKNLGALGEGGLLTTNREEIAETVRSLRNHGETSRYQHERLGYNYRMTAFQGAVLRVKLPRLEAWNEERRRLAARYRDELADLGGHVLETMQETPGARPVYHLFPVQVDERDAVRNGLREAGIETRIHYPEPLHRQPAFVNHRPAGTDTDRTAALPALPVTESVAARVLSLPLWPGMSEDQLRQVTDRLHELLG